MSAPPLARSEQRHRALLPALFIGVFMAALDTAVIGPAIPALQASFGVDTRQVGLVMVVFVLFSLSSTALMAALSDRHGRRPIYLAAVGAFAIGSLLIAAADQFAWILAGRAIQGIGAGGIVPVASAVVGDAVAPERRGRALGLIGAVYGMAFVLGPPLAGVLLVAFSWQAIFLANLPIAALILFLASRALPSRRVAASLPPFDLPGVVLTFALLATVALAITGIADDLAARRLWPWLLAAAGVLLLLLIRVERVAVQPALPLALFVNRQLAIAYVLTVGAGFGMGSVAFLASLAVRAYGVTPAQAGFVLLPLVLCSMAGSMGAGRLLARLGPRTLLLWGFAALAVGYAGCALTRFGLTGFIAASVPVGLGVGIVVGGALRMIAIDEAPAALRGTAQGLINVGTGVGTLLSAAAVAAVADLRGGGADGFAAAYVMVAALMALMLPIGAALRRIGQAPPARSH